MEYLCRNPSRCWVNLLSPFEETDPSCSHRHPHLVVILPLLGDDVQGFSRHPKKLNTGWNILNTNGPTRKLLLRKVNHESMPFVLPEFRLFPLGDHGGLWPDTGGRGSGNHGQWPCRCVAMRARCWWHSQVCSLCRLRYYIFVGWRSFWLKLGGTHKIYSNLN